MTVITNKMKQTYLSLEWLKAQGATPKWFGLGFIQLKLNEHERMHFYTRKFSANVSDEEIHDHRYEFTSTILKGTLEQHFYIFQDNPEGDWEKTKVSCDPENPHDGKSVWGDVQWLTCVSHPKGSRYTIHPHTFHRVISTDAITLVERGSFDRSNLATVIRPFGATEACPFKANQPSEEELWGEIERMLMHGYHSMDIDKGVLGESSKVLEEAWEFADAVEQHNPVMALVELSDLYGAMREYLSRHHPTVTLSDLETMADATRRSFIVGHRQ